MLQQNKPPSPAKAFESVGAAPAWSSVALTKFRAPQLRASIVPRLPLLQRLQALTALCRVTLVCAPAGFGKSTLLAQFAAQPGQAVETAWLSLDEDDNDPNRLFVSLLGVLRKIPLEWPADPLMLASQVDSGGPGARAAVAGLINALCSYPGERLLLIIDDLHRINDDGALRLLDALMDRLPPEVGVVMGSRIEPELSLPRWRAHGELGELLAANLQFSETEAYAFAAARFADTVSPELVQHALARTQGWAAGLQLLFGSANIRVRPGSDVPVGDADRHLFDYFAAEVLAELPPDLRDFLLQCAILPELDPARCAAVTGRGDAQAVLDELYRRNLFLTVLDERTPVLRLHDLFRDYLRDELELRSQRSIRELHAKAAAAEPVLPRAVTHWLKAQCWEEAVALIQRCAEPLLAEGGYAMIERWLTQLPREMQQQHSEVAYLQAMCHWARYDFPGMREPLQRARAGLRRQGGTKKLAQALIMLAHAHQFMGDLAASAKLLQEAECYELDLPLRSAFHAMSAWQALADGRPDEVAPALQVLIDAAERDVTTLYPAICDIFNSLLYGLPGTLKPLRRLREICVDWSKQAQVHWQVAAMAHTAWPDFWRGERAAAVAALEEQWRFHDRMGLPGLWLNLHLLTCWVRAASGEFEQALEMMQRNLRFVESEEFGSLAAGWRRYVLLNLAWVYWMAQDADGLAQLLPRLEPARRAEEWPAVDTGRAQVFGQFAMLTGRHEEAEAHLLHARELYQRWRMSSFMGNPSTSLAMLRLRQGDHQAAWAEFKPVLDAALSEDCIGDLLLEPREPLAGLLGLIPAAERKDYDAILARLAAWRTAPLSPVASAGDISHRLSERELEVLQRIAAGDSNKQIARTLELSPHTVKRHVANILAKLDVATRRQAAAWWRERYRGAG